MHTTPRPHQHQQAPVTTAPPHTHTTCAATDQHAAYTHTCSPAHSRGAQQCESASLLLLRPASASIFLLSRGRHLSAALATRQAVGPVHNPRVFFSHVSPCSLCKSTHTQQTTRTRTHTLSCTGFTKAGDRACHQASAHHTPASQPSEGRTGMPRQVWTAAAAAAATAVKVHKSRLCVAAYTTWEGWHGMCVVV